MRKPTSRFLARKFASSPVPGRPQTDTCGVHSLESPNDAPWNLRWKGFPRPSWEMAVVLAAVILFASGLLDGGFYSSHLAYRRQTEAFFHGAMGLGNDARTVGHDLVWDNGTVQHVWGLGVPAWRMPFEAIAKVFSVKAFPDRLAFGIALTLTIFVLLRFHWKAMAESCPGLPPSRVIITALPLVLSPVLLTLCFSAFEVYEEAVAYGFLSALIAMVWTAKLCCKCSVSSFVGLCLFAGFLPFIRPTLLFYGISSVVVGGLALWQSGRSVGVPLLGSLGFLVGIGFLMVTNTVRFGSPVEFGHALNTIPLPPMLYAARFDNPYWTEPLPSAIRELISATFLSRIPPGNAWPWPYTERIFSGQSPSFRWRAMYLSTFDWTWLAFLLGSWSWLARKWWRHIRMATQLRPGALEAVCLWSVFPVLFLAVFYLRFPFLSSRYLLDFGAALTAAVWVAMILLLRVVHLNRHRCPLLDTIWVAALVWWSLEVATIKAIGNAQAVTYREIGSRIQQLTQRVPDRPFPPVYESGFDFQETGIPFNGSGWNADGSTDASVLLYVVNPEFLDLDVSLIGKGDFAAASYDRIQAKIGNERLERESITPTKEGMRIIFRRPERKRYQTGIQQVVVAMMSPQELNAGRSRFRLRKVGWRADAKALGVEPLTPQSDSGTFGIRNSKARHGFSTIMNRI
jgi:hypothetical protein